MLWRMVTKITV